MKPKPNTTKSLPRVQSKPHELLNMHENVYGVVLTVLVDDDPNSYGEWLDSVGFHGERLDALTRKGIYEPLRTADMDDGSDSEFIWLRSKNHGALAHELLHFVIQTFHDKAIPISYENDETICYYLEYWFNRITSEWSKL